MEITVKSWKQIASPYKKIKNIFKQATISQAEINSVVIINSFYAVVLTNGTLILTR